MDAGEKPRQTIERELHEELGVQNISLVERGFTHHRHGKIILFFAGTLAEDMQVTIDMRELRGAVWVSLDMIRDNSIDVGDYREAILDNVST